MSPLIATSQNISINYPGDEPDITDTGIGIQEDCSLLGPPFINEKGIIMSNRKRKSFFSTRENLETYSFDPSLVYTFDFFQHVLNMGTFQLDIGFLKLDILKSMGCRPIQVMAVHWDPTQHNTSLDLSRSYSFLYNIEVWHERSLPKGFQSRYSWKNEIRDSVSNKQIETVSSNDTVDVIKENKES
mmetsp:Transcript_6711/g.6934  ORF Transcript_6711/g.6934 Transcript_6711/m.6934 type:complete len:186 (+) Transcript_6711:578-1135(+)